MVLKTIIQLLCLLAAPLGSGCVPDTTSPEVSAPLWYDVTGAEGTTVREVINSLIKRYPEFSEFYGMEDAVENIVSFFRHAAQGLEEKKQILYLLGPGGGGKSSLAEKLKALMQRVPFYAIKGSPVNDSPLALFDPEEDAPILEEEYGIPSRYLKSIMSPWAVKQQWL